MFNILREVNLYVGDEGQLARIAIQQIGDFPPAAASANSRRPPDK